jgi:hAT family C-terminal dimerisation region
MAVTAHYIHETPSQLKCQARLIAFRHIPGTHEGAAIGSHFVDILVGLKIEHKVGQITADNASNNNTMLGWIEDALTACSIPFSRLSNRIRYVITPLHLRNETHPGPHSCFPHIINLAAQELVDSLKHTPATDGVDRTFLQLLQLDPVAHCRELIVACRLTSLRRKEFRDTITDLNKSGAKVPNLALIYDVVTRWSATFNMISRFLLIQQVSYQLLRFLGLTSHSIQVVTAFLAKPRNHDILREKGLNSADLAVLGHIIQVLLVFHRAQELLSSERTPTLALVLPAYELIFQILRMYINTNQFPHLNFAIRASVTKLEGYMEMARQNECYGMAMFLNPSSKKGWMVKHWTNAEVERCMRKITEAMLAYRREECGHSPASTSQHPTLTAHDQAADNLGAGFRGLEDLFASLSRAASNGSSSLDEPVQVPVETIEDQEVLNRNKVEAEVLRYISDPPFSQAMTTLTLMEWWKIHQHTYPVLWKVARDILPTQASSVPCERVFSSSKQTTTPQRNALSPDMVEKLQILKFGLKQKQLDFTDGWIKQPEEMIGGLDHLEDSDFAQSES